MRAIVGSESIALNATSETMLRSASKPQTTETKPKTGSGICSLGWIFRIAVSIGLRILVREIETYINEVLVEGQALVACKSPRESRCRGENVEEGDRISRNGHDDKDSGCRLRLGRLIVDFEDW